MSACFIEGETAAADCLPPVVSLSEETRCWRRWWALVQCRVQGRQQRRGKRHVRAFGSRRPLSSTPSLLTPSVVSRFSWLSHLHLPASCLCGVATRWVYCTPKVLWSAVDHNASRGDHCGQLARIVVHSWLGNMRFQEDVSVLTVWKLVVLFSCASVCDRDVSSSSRLLRKRAFRGTSWTVIRRASLSNDEGDRWQCQVV